MRKASKAFFSVVIMLTLATLTATFSSAASTATKDNIYRFLTEEIGFNSAAACGIMANIEHESDFDSTEVIIDSNGRLSGGLCQWNGARFSSLKSFCNKNGYGYLSVTGQLKYLEYELQKSSFKHIYDYLKGVTNDAQGAYDAAYYWCYYFEIPANRSTKSIARGNNAKNTYWAKYGNQKLASVKLTSKQAGKTLDLDKSVTLSWNSAGSNVTTYTVYLARKGSSGYNWDKAQKIKLSSDCTSYTLKLAGKKEGSYKAYVLAENASKSKKSNTVSFSVKCLDHSYTVKTAKLATTSAPGIKQYTCEKCGHTYNKSIPALSKETAGKLKLSALKVTSASKKSVTLSAKLSDSADGYIVYRYSGGSWKKVATSKGKKAVIKSLKPGKTYTFKLQPYCENGENKIYGSYYTIKAATKPEAAVLTSIARPSAKTVSIKWDKVSGADGYGVYYSTTYSGKYTRADILSADATSYTYKNLKSGETYYFKVIAFNKSKANTAFSSSSNIKFAVAL